MKIEKNEIKSTAHSKYRCQYHIVFAPKYRRKEIYGKLKRDIGEILRKLCEQKGVEIIEAEACPDHIHMLVSIPPHISIAQFMGYLKGKSSLMIFDRHANLKYTETDDTSYLDVDGIFVAIGQKPENKPFARVCKLNDYGYVDAGENCLTGTDGIYVAGDCRSKTVRQITTATGDGAVAALAACKYIEMER